MSDNIFKNLEIFALSGKLGSGKNFIAENILNRMLTPTPTLFVSLADHFKVDVVVKDGVPHEKVFHKKDDVTRVKLQLRGTEEGRNVYGADIWVNTLKEWIRIYAERGTRRFILCDCRFHNELDELQDLGAYTIRVVAPNRNEAALQAESNGNPEKYLAIANHRSETELDAAAFHYIINNDKDDNAFLQVRRMVLHLREVNRMDTVAFVDLDDTITSCHKYYQQAKDNFYKYLTGFVYDTSLTGMQTFNAAFRVANDLAFGEKYITTPVYIGKLASAFRHITGNVISLLREDVDMVVLFDEIDRIGREVYDSAFEPIPGALAALETLKGTVDKVVIFTMGDQAIQAGKIASAGLHDTDFHVVPFKDTGAFQTLMAKYAANNYIMIGDSFQRDIAPCLNLPEFTRLYHITPNTVNNALRGQGKVCQVVDLAAAVMLMCNQHAHSDVSLAA